LDYWHSSRQITDTITEFPLFTIWLGDLHPHLLSMPIICLALLIAWQTGRDGPKILQTIVLAVLFGVAWAANPWSMPPTLVGIALLLFAGPDQWHWPGGEGTRRWLAVAAIAVGGWIVTAPFHLDFQPFFQGVNMVFAWTPVRSLLLYAGCLLIPAALAALALLRRLVGGDEEANRAIVLLGMAAVLVVAAASGRPTLVILAAICVPLLIAVLSSLAGEDRPALALAALGVFLFLVPEIVYVVDSYGEDLHRMNTVFKSYIQAWIFVSIALPVLLRWGLKRQGARLGMVAAMVLVALPHVTGMFWQQIVAEERGLNGVQWMTAGDRAIVHFLRQQPPGTVIAEVVGGAYTEYARFSAASGVPAYLGWANHESVWRGNEILPETERRSELIMRLYSSGDAVKIRRTVEEAGIHLVTIGSLESKDFSEQQLAEVAAAGEVVLDEDGGQVIRFASPIDGRSASGPDMMEP
jgi:YYY domain-containing protein